MTSATTLHVDTVPRYLASAYTALAIVENTGKLPVRLSTEPGNPLHDRIIAASETFEVEPRGATVNVSADKATTVAVTWFTVGDLRADAAAEFRVPVELITGRDKAAIAESAARFLQHETAATEESA